MPLVDPKVSILRKIKRGALRQYRRTDDPAALEAMYNAQTALDQMATPEAEGNITNYKAKMEYRNYMDRKGRADAANAMKMANKYRRAESNFLDRISKVDSASKLSPKDRAEYDAYMDSLRPERLGSSGNTALNNSRNAFFGVEQDDEKNTYAAAEETTPTDEEKRTSLTAGANTTTPSMTPATQGPPASAMRNTGPQQDPMSRVMVATPATTSQSELGAQRSPMERSMAPAATAPAAPAGPRINRLTGLPFGYRPGDELPENATDAMKGAAMQSMQRQSTATATPQNPEQELSTLETMRQDGAIGSRVFNQQRTQLMSRVRQERAQRLADQSVAADTQALAAREEFIPSGVTRDQSGAYRLPQGVASNPMIDRANAARASINPRTGSQGNVSLTAGDLAQLEGRAASGDVNSQVSMPAQGYLDRVDTYLKGESTARPQAKSILARRRREVEALAKSQEVDRRTGSVYTPPSRRNRLTNTAVKFPRYGMMSRQP